MIFIRSQPPPCDHYSDYRESLREDFQNRCAYCLTREGHFPGGQVNFQIDHHRPQKGRYARPDLENVYANLYWTCHACNRRKSSIWPSPEQEAAGQKWLDPCEAWGDHDEHWRIFPDGEIIWLTPVGEYTVKKLRLANLKRHWQNLHRWRQKREEFLRRLPELPHSPERDAIEQILRELQDLIEPPPE